MRELVFDPFAGISGDMVLGALVDLGLDPDWLRDLVADLRVPDVRVEIGRTARCGIDCARVRFEIPAESKHRHLSDVLEIVDASPCASRVRERASDIFRRLAAAEGEVHGVAPERVHFHEVGAIDSILDVLCGVAGVAELGFERVRTRPVALGRGWVDTAHGRFPVPAPATLKLLQRLTVRETSLEGECTTPTGAALLAGLVDDADPPAEYIVVGSGYGAGARDPRAYPNCLRAVAAEVAAVSRPLFLVQADIDDMSPEYVPPAQDALLEAGALDAVATPIGMKKGRAALRLEALVPDERLDLVLETLFRATTTIGARYWPVTRPVLERLEEVVEWRGQRLRRKRVRLPGGGERVKVEFDDVARAAASLGMTPLEVRTSLETEGAHLTADE